MVFQPQGWLASHSILAWEVFSVKCASPKGKGMGKGTLGQQLVVSLLFFSLKPLKVPMPILKERFSQLTEWSGDCVLWPGNLTIFFMMLLMCALSSKSKHKNELIGPLCWEDQLSFSCSILTT